MTGTTASDADLEAYLLLLLSDSNLPSGGFVASGGLESTLQHGLLPLSSATGSNSTPGPAAGSKHAAQEALIDFVARSLHNLSTSSLPYVHRAWAESNKIYNRSQASQGPGPEEAETSKAAEERLAELDELYHAQTTSHIARRASTAQGVALLTLYERAFAPDGEVPSMTRAAGDQQEGKRTVKALKARIRAHKAHGHLPVGFGVLTGLLGLSLQGTTNLYHYTHARSILSSAVRLNLVGPYVAHKLLLHDVRPLVDRVTRQALEQSSTEDWQDDDEDGPAMTWPLGEILGARHDQLHSKIFNS